jgi:heterodisulfide reductase subunit C2
MALLNSLQMPRDCDESFIHQVETESRQQISKCYQCGNCSASCAYTYVYDYPVNQIMRLIQLGQKEVVLRSRSIWLCADCQACTTRCPCNIDIARVMETLRFLSVEEGTVSIKDIQLFYDEFINSVKTFGRVFETGLLATYNLKAKKLFTDIDLAPKVLKKGKLPIIPHRIRGRKKVSDIFKRFEDYRNKKNLD